MQDDELQNALRQAREPDREDAPSFGATWGRAAQRGEGARRRRLLAGAAALAAVVVALIVGWPDTTAHREPRPGDEMAQTEPKPDIPLDEPPDRAADWSAATLDKTPTDFLLDDDSTLAGDLPSDQLLPDDTLDLDDDSLREL